MREKANEIQTSEQIYFRVDGQDINRKSGWDLEYGPVIFNDGRRGFFTEEEAEEFIKTVLKRAWGRRKFRIVEIRRVTTKTVLGERVTSKPL